MTVTKDDIQFDGDRVQLESGWYAVVSTAFDESMGAPWKEHDGHGEVSDWRNYRDKRAGEMELHRDGQSARFYDFAGAVRLALKDGWGCPHIHSMEDFATFGGHKTKREMAAHAAESDFQRMRAWCNDEWQWIGVIATLYDAEGVEVESESLWGIESDTDYWRDVAADLVNSLARGICAPVATVPRA